MVHWVSTEPDGCSLCNPPHPLSCSRTVYGSHLLWDTNSQIRCWDSLPQSRSRTLRDSPSSYRMKKAMSLNMLNVDGPKAAGTQVRGALGSRLE